MSLFKLFAIPLLIGSTLSAQTLADVRKLADKGNPDGQFAVGGMYETGQGAPQNYEEAMRWYRKAADQGHSAAMVNLDLMYGQGEGVPVDLVEKG